MGQIKENQILSDESCGQNLWTGNSVKVCRKKSESDKYVGKKQKLENVRKEKSMMKNNKNHLRKSDTKSDMGLRSDMASEYDTGSSSGYEERCG